MVSLLLHSCSSAMDGVSLVSCVSSSENAHGRTQPVCPVWLKEALVVSNFDASRVRQFWMACLTTGDLAHKATMGQAAPVIPKGKKFHKDYLSIQDSGTSKKHTRATSGNGKSVVEAKDDLAAKKVTTKKPSRAINKAKKEADKVLNKYLASFSPRVVTSTLSWSQQPSQQQSQQNSSEPKFLVIEPLVTELPVESQKQASVSSQHTISV